MSPDQQGTATPPIERREDHAKWRAQVDARLDDGAKKMRSLALDLKANTDATKAVKDDTSELVSLLKSFQGAFKVFNLIGKAAKPLGYIAMACSALLGLWAAIKGGGIPK